MNVFADSPFKRRLLVIKIEPVQPGPVHFRIDTGLCEQTLGEVRVEVLRPVRQRSDRRAVAPWVKRRNNPAARPGRLLTNARTIQQHDPDLLGRQIEGSQQTYDATADNDYFCLDILVS